MQVFGLPSHIVRNGRAASRLLAAKSQAYLDAFACRFNHHRPHDALAGRTPAEYLKSLSRGDPKPSHIC
jgi:transposase InsO family protein